MRSSSIAAVLCAVCGAAAVCVAEPVQTFGGKPASSKQAPAPVAESAQAVQDSSPGAGEGAPRKARRVSAVNESPEQAIVAKPEACQQPSLGEPGGKDAKSREQQGRKEAESVSSGGARAMHRADRIKRLSAARNESESPSAQAVKPGGAVRMDPSKVSRAAEAPKAKVAAPSARARSEASKATPGPVSGAGPSRKVPVQPARF